MAKEFNRGSDGNLTEKSYKQLKKLIDLYDQYNNIRHAGSLATQEEIQAEIDLREKLSNLIKSKGIKDIQGEEAALRELYAAQTEIIKAKKEEQKQQEKINRLNQEFNDIWNDTGKESYKTQLAINKIKDDAIKKATKLNTTEKQRQKIIQDALKTQKELEKKYNEQLEKENKAAAKEQAKTNMKKSMVESLLGNNFKNNGGLDAVKNGTYMFNMAANVFSSAVNMFKEAVKMGIDTNYNATEKYFNSITASNSRSYGLSYGSGSFSFGGRTYSGYKQINNAINDQLGSENLLNNISNVDVVGAVSTLTSSGGYNLEAAIAKGYQDTVIKYIVPYLDTSSEAFNTLEYVMPGISKNVAATAIAAKDQFGENQYIAKYSSQLVELMTPVALQANKELYSAQYQEIAKSLEARVASGQLTAAEAQQIANEAFSMYMDPTGTLQTGNVISKLTTIDAINEGGIDKPASYVTNYLENTGWALGLGGDNTLATNAIANAWGIPNFRIRENLKEGAEGITVENYEEQLDIFKQQVGLADDMNTTTDKINKAVINATADIADIKTLLGDKLWSLGEMIVAGITGYIGAKVIGGVIGKSLGIIGGSGAGGSGAGFASLLSGGAGVAVSAVAISAMAIAIGSAVADKMWSGSGEHGKSKATEELDGTSLENNTAASTLLATANAQMDAGWFQQEFGNVGAGISMGFSNLFQGKADKNKNFLQWAIQSGALNTGDRNTNLGYLFTLATIYAQNGYLDAFNKGLNEAGIEGVKINSKKEIGQAMVEMGMTKEAFNSYKNALFKSGWARINTENGTLESFEIDAEQFGISGVNGFRYGLENVPYDEYPALLHKGETVLTATSANILRTLLEEYRTANTQAVNFDVIVQNQTIALVTKMDEIIKTINSNNGSAFSPSTDKVTGLGILTNSLAHITSTKAL